MKLKSPSTEAKYSIAAMVIVVALVATFAIMAGATTYQYLRTTKPTTIAATPVSHEPRTSGANQSANSDKADQQKSEPTAPQPAPATGVLPAATTKVPDCKLIEKTLHDTLGLVNTTQYKVYENSRDSLLNKLVLRLSEVLPGDIDLAYGSYKQAMETAHNDYSTKLQQAGCQSLAKPLTLLPH